MVKATGLAKKGAPPARTETPDIVAADPRAYVRPTRPLQFKVPPELADNFNREANERHGHKIGGKTALFLELWQRQRERA